MRCANDMRPFRCAAARLWLDGGDGPVRMLDIGQVRRNFPRFRIPARPVEGEMQPPIGGHHNDERRRETGRHARGACRGNFTRGGSAIG